jgi:hypothetical protein
MAPLILIMKYFVTGPQRSGSTFVSRCLSHDYGILHFDEVDYGLFDYKRFVDLVKGHGSWVVHGPAMFHRTMDVVKDFPDATIVVVRRDIKDILKSQERIQWDDRMERRNLRVRGDKRPIAQIKYDIWDVWKCSIKHYLEYQYGDFSRHPLWVDKEQRTNFKQKQWGLEG